MKTKMKTGQVLTISRELPAGEKAGAELDRLNKRYNQIAQRLGVIQSESAKLCAEQHSIEIRRSDLRRQFDQISRGD